MFFYAHIQSHCSYASTVWCNAAAKHIKQLNILHKRAIKTISQDTHLTTNEKYTHLEILTLTDHFKYNAGLAVCKQKLKKSPSYIQDMFPTPVNRRTLQYKKPQYSSDNADKIETSFACYGASVWNNVVPLQCRARCNLSSFKKSLRKYLLKNPSPL